MSEQMLNQILNELKKIKTTMATKRELDGLKQNVSRIEEKQDTMDERIGRMEEKQDTMGERMGRMEEKQDTVDERMSRMEEKLDVTREQVVKNTETISVIRNEQQQIKQAVLETSGDVKTLMASQAKQDKILERLSVRSIEHESDIAELRKIK